MKRWVNFYPPCDQTRHGHPWRTTSWVSRAFADQNAEPGRLACVEVEFKAGDGIKSPQNEG
jgi:hypothetical protein